MQLKLMYGAASFHHQGYFSYCKNMQNVANVALTLIKHDVNNINPFMHIVVQGISVVMETLSPASRYITG